MRLQFKNPYDGLATLEQLTGELYQNEYTCVRRVILELNGRHPQQGIIEYSLGDSMQMTQYDTVFLEDTVEDGSEIEELLEGDIRFLLERPAQMQATRYRYRRSRRR